MPWLDHKPSGYYIRDRKPSISIPLGKIPLQDARAALLHYEEEKAAGRAGTPGAAINQVVQQYFTDMERLHYSDKSMRTKEQSLRYFTAKVQTVNQITQDYVAAFKDTMFAKGLSRDTVGIRLRDVRAFLNWCVREGKIRRSPFTVQIPEGRKDAGRDITQAQLQAFLKWIAENAPVQVRRAVIIFFYSGARLSEVLGADLSDFDRTRRIWYIPYAKGHKKREVPLRREVLEVLPKGTHGPLYTGSEWPIRYWWKLAALAAGIRGRFRIHDARHNFASYFMRATGDWMSLMEICGWSSPAMAKRYTHLGKDHLIAKIDQMRLK